MTHKERRSIVRSAKSKTGWYDGEAAQDKLIEVGCKKRGYELSDFYAENGIILNKLLK